MVNIDFNIFLMTVTLGQPCRENGGHQSIKPKTKVGAKQEGEDGIGGRKPRSVESKEIMKTTKVNTNVILTFC